MTISEFAELLTALASAGAFIFSVYNARKITEVKHATNSMKDELVVEVRKAAHAAGVEAGREEEKMREKN